MDIEKQETLESTELKTIQTKEKDLITYFKNRAEVSSLEQGYISAPFVNQQIDPKL